jgi:hypothetical protein
MAAGELDFTIEQGATFDMPLAWRDADGTLIDTSGYTARMQVRETVTSGTAMIDLTNGDGITLGIGTTSDGFQYNVRVGMTSGETAALTLDRTQKAVYDLELSGGGIVTRLLKGRITLDPEVTR